MSFEQCYQLYTPRESWNQRNMVGRRTLRYQMLTSSKLRGHHTEAPRNSTHAHIFNFEINIWNRNVDFKIAIAQHMRMCLGVIFQVVAYACLRSFWCTPSFILAQCSRYLTNELILHCFGWGTCPCYPKLVYATTEMWHPGTLNLQIHFTISNLNARRKLKMWACEGSQGASVCWPQISQRKTRYATI